MKSEIGSTRQDLVALSEEAGADAKLIQHEPLGFSYPCKHPIPTVLHGAQLQGKKKRCPVYHFDHTMFYWIYNNSTYVKINKKP
jgi:hypothetical protein